MKLLPPAEAAKSPDGSSTIAFYIGFKDDKKAYEKLPYQEANNAHVVEAAIRAAFKKGVDRLSDVLTNG